MYRKFGAIHKYVPNHCREEKSSSVESNMKQKRSSTVSGQQVECAELRACVERMAVEAERQLRAMAHPEMKERLKAKVKKALGRPGYAGDLIFWPAGLLLLGLLEADHLQVVEEYLGEWIRQGMPVKNPDDALTGLVMIRLYRRTGNEPYRKGAEKIAQYLESCRRDTLGSVVYGQRSSNRWIYADGAGQVSMFCAEYANAFGTGTSAQAAQPEEPRNEAKKLAEQANLELSNFALCGMDEATGLPYHGYDAESGACYGIIGWGRAAGWLMMGIAAWNRSYAEAEKSTESIPVSKVRPDCSQEKDGQKTAAHENAGQNLNDKIVRMRDSIVPAILTRRREDGLFSWQLDCRKGPLDTSASGMIYYSLLTGDLLRKGADQNLSAAGNVSGQETLPNGTAQKNAWDAGGVPAEDIEDIYAAAAKALLGYVDENGRVQQSSAECIDFAQYRQQYGNNPWGQGAVLAFLAAYSKKVKI